MTSDFLEQVRAGGKIPKHVAIIMDGNGRWALQRGLPRHAGHREGMKSVREALEGSMELGVEILTLFAFSTENWNRPPREISALMGLLELYARKEKAELVTQGVQVHVLGDLDRLSPRTRRAVNGIMDATALCNRLRLTADGKIVPCLFSDHGYSIREMGIEEAFRNALHMKPECGDRAHMHSFYNIGG